MKLKNISKLPALTEVMPQEDFSCHLSEVGDVRITSQPTLLFSMFGFKTTNVQQQHELLLAIQAKGNEHHVMLENKINILYLHYYRKN